jgi:4-hydroxybenzoate polyprenyltransferase
LVVAAGIAAYHLELIGTREPARCFKAFLHNNYIGLVLFAGVVLDLWRA